MKRLKITGLCLVAMFAMGILASATASAAPARWEQCAEGVENSPPTKYEGNQCLNTSGSGNKWQWNEVKGTEVVRILGMTLRFTDLKTAAGRSTVVCSHIIEEEFRGFVGPENKGRITMASANKPSTECVSTEGGCEKNGVEEVRGVNLPWQTELFETEKKVLTKIVSTGAPGAGKEAGWEVRCKTVLGSETDRCESEGSSKLEEMLLENAMTKSGGSLELLVLGTYEKRHLSICSKGGKEAGEMEGRIAILKENGRGLRIS